jgi:hypothetical protein
VIVTPPNAAVAGMLENSQDKVRKRQEREINLMVVEELDEAAAG